MIDLSSVPNIPPGFIFIFGAVLLPLLGKGKARTIYLIILAALGLISVAVMREPQTSWVFSDLIFLQVDRLSLLMGYIFTIAGGCAILYSLPSVKDNGHHMCALLYLGSALGAVFAGDFFSLYIFWEIMAFSSLGLIWYEGSQRARDAGMRYILFHLFGGCALLGGIVLHYMSTGSIAIGPVEYGIGYFLLLLGIGVNTAFIMLHTWLPDSYPKATIAGTIFLSIFTTKTGVYVLARTFSGAEISIHGQEFLFVAYIGGAMCLYGVIFAILQNDVRKLLSYHIVSQLGYMVAGRNGRARAWGYRDRSARTGDRRRFRSSFQQSAVQDNSVYVYGRGDIQNGEEQSHRYGRTGKKDADNDDNMRNSGSFYIGHSRV
jgi:multicomponent Na+:H+ antiporter subunit D